MNPKLHSPALAGLLSAGGVLWASAGRVLAAEKGPEPAPLPVMPDLLSAGGRMIAALILVIGVMLVVLYLLRRLSASRRQLFGGPALIRVLGTKALGPKKYIALVEVGGSVLTLGITAEHISRLDKVSSESFHQMNRPPKAEDNESFAGKLSRMTGDSSAKSEEPL